METTKFSFRFRNMLVPIFLIIIAGVISFFFCKGAEKEEFRLVPKERTRGDGVDQLHGTVVWTGWSDKEDPEEAVKEAVYVGWEGNVGRPPDFTIVFATSGSDMEGILSKLREMFGNETKIYGGSSDSRAVMINRKYVRVTDRGYAYSSGEGKKGLAVMAVTSDKIFFGVGSANFSAFPSVQEASKYAMLRAIKSAEKSVNELPKAILITPTIGAEEEVVEGIEEVVGKNTPIIGGTSGGPTFAVFGENKVYEEGISLAVIYTDLHVGWAFEGGFDVKTPQTGVVTKSDGQAIIEIDNRPALDVYDEWLDGEIGRLCQEIGKPDVVRDLLILHPIYRKYTSSNGQDYFLFSHPWPKDESFKDRTVMTSTKIKTGERIYLSHGTWETLINRIENLPKNAKVRGRISVDKKPIFGIGYICAGVMGIIPETEREKFPLLLGYANNDAPFIVNFTWGEQGHFPGIGNKHGNLLTSFLVISAES